MAVQFELESLDMRPDPEPLLVEMIHAVQSFLILSDSLSCMRQGMFTLSGAHVEPLPIWILTPVYIINWGVLLDNAL